MNSQTNDNINVMSANIRFANEADGKNNWHFRKSFVADIINGESIHLLGTQEGREGQIKELCSLLPNLQLIETHRDWIEERMYPCIYFDNSKFKVRESGDIWLSETPSVLASKSFGSMFPRLCTYAFMEQIKDQKQFLFINSHLDHLQEEIRLKQVKVLIKEIEKLNIKKVPIILVGDFNSGPYQSVRRELNSSNLNLKDPWIEANKEEETSFHKFDGIDPTGEALRIDWTLIDQEIDFSYIEIIKESRKSLFPSDHFFMKVSLNKLV